MPARTRWTSARSQDPPPTHSISNYYAYSNLPLGLRRSSSYRCHAWRAGCNSLTLRNSGNRRLHNTTIRIVPTPPTTTAGNAPHHAAVTPDSNCPTSFDVPMNIMLTALTRPRISSGVEICTSVCRTTTLTMSHAPSTTSAATDNPTFRDSPNTTVHAPNPPTHHSMIAPACRLNGRCASTIAMITAPVPGAPRRIPNPVAPTPRMSFANTGISATAPPSSTANMSSEIAPNVIFARHR